MSTSQETSSNRADIRFIIHHGHRYLRAEDIVSLILEMAGTEEVDVRNRFEELAYNLRDAFVIEY